MRIVEDWIEGIRHYTEMYSSNFCGRAPEQRFKVGNAIN